MTSACQQLILMQKACVTIAGKSKDLLINTVQGRPKEKRSLTTFEKISNVLVEVQNMIALLALAAAQILLT